MFESFPDSEGIKTQNLILTSSEVCSSFESFPDSEGIKTILPARVKRPGRLNPSLIQKGLRRHGRLNYGPSLIQKGLRRRLNPQGRLNPSLIQKGLRHCFAFSSAYPRFCLNPSLIQKGLRLLPSADDPRFESFPDSEGIKTPRMSAAVVSHRLRFESFPDSEGIKTPCSVFRGKQLVV